MAAPRKTATIKVQFQTKFLVVIDFTVEGKYIPPARRSHRLCTGGRKVQD
jgi:hypothetical protein